MYRPRIIPVLLLKDGGLVKSIHFKNYRYIGDPINAVKIFNDQKADELAFLDITATKEKRFVSLELVKKVGEEANMPFSVGGGIRKLDEIQKIIEAGAEKVILNTITGENENFIHEAVNEFGSSTIVVCIDIKKKFLGEYKAWIKNGKKKLSYSPIDFAKKMEDLGAGEIIIQSIEKDGTMSGYDIELVQSISQEITIPITALGGAGNLLHIKALLNKAVVNGLAAGSMFIYHGSRKGILINYPSKDEISDLFNEELN